MTNLSKTADSLSAQGPGVDMAARNPGPVPLLVPVCAWPLGCDEIATERDVCSYHADKLRDLWADDGD